jgi:two-component system nitrate/nitrite response regulator NarL
MAGKYRSMAMTSYHDPAVIELHVDNNSKNSCNRVCVYHFDTHPIILKGMVSALKEFFPEADYLPFGSLAELERTLSSKTDQPELVILEYECQELATVGAVSEFISRNNVQTAVMTISNDVNIARELINIGCIGLIHKSIKVSTICHIVRLMADGGYYIPDFLVVCHETEAAEEVEHIVTSGRQKYGLTRREVEVLRSLAAGHTNRQIARELLIEEVAVKLHLRRAYAKLSVRNRIEAVRAVFQGALD